jgi:histidine phosphotransferase ChpT
LVRGGRLDIGAERHDARRRHVIRAEGSRIVLDPELVVSCAATPAARSPPRRRRLARQSLIEEGRRRTQLMDEETGVLLIGASLRR